jgi:hypothetical protein
MRRDRTRSRPDPVYVGHDGEPIDIDAPPAREKMKMSGDAMDDQDYEDLSADNAALRSENARLREALEGLVGTFEDAGQYGPRPDVVQLRLRRACAALNGKGEGK